MSEEQRLAALEEAWLLLRYLWTAEVAPVQFLRAQREGEIVAVRDCFDINDSLIEDFDRLAAILDAKVPA